LPNTPAASLSIPYKVGPSNAVDSRIVR
jgi:hypothetical protein